MASMTLTIDSATLKAAELAAKRRETSLDQMISEYVASIANESDGLANADNLIRLMDEGLLGHIDQPLTRDEVYAERTWPRS